MDPSRTHGREVVYIAVEVVRHHKMLRIHSIPGHTTRIVASRPVVTKASALVQCRVVVADRRRDHDRMVRPFQGNR